MSFAIKLYRAQANPEYPAGWYYEGEQKYTLVPTDGTGAARLFPTLKAANAAMKWARRWGDQCHVVRMQTVELGAAE